MIEEINGGVATLAYTGKSSASNGDTPDFPNSFTGTATYIAPGNQSQGDAASTSHLHNGTKLVANIDNAVPGTNGEPGAKIQFKHATSVYRITFNAPATIPATANPTLSIETVEGVFGETSLGFSMTKNQEYTVYLHGSEEGNPGKITFRLDYEGENNHIVIYAYKDLGENISLENGKYYGVDLRNVNPTSETYPNKEFYAAMGNAPLGSYLNIGIPLDADHKFVDLKNHPEKASEVAYYLYPAKDVLRDADGNVQYFYWGEVVGHRLDNSGNVVTNGSEGPFPNSFSYSKTDGDWGCVAQMKNPAMDLYFNDGTLLKKWWQNHLSWIECKQFNNDNYYYYALKSRDMLDEGEGLEVVKDAPSYRWGGKWRMMGYHELRAFLQAINGTPDGTGNDIRINFEVYYNTSTYKTVTVSYPKTGYVSGLTKVDNPTKNTFMTWLRFSKPTHKTNEGYAQTDPDTESAIYWRSDYPFQYYPESELQADGYIYSNVFYGRPILPVLVVEKQVVPTQD